MIGKKKNWKKKLEKNSTVVGLNSGLSSYISALFLCVQVRREGHQESRKADMLEAEIGTPLTVSASPVIVIVYGVAVLVSLFALYQQDIPQMRHSRSVKVRNVM